MSEFLFFMWLNIRYCIICIQHISFTYSSVSGNLGCFHLLTITNNATTTKGVQKLFDFLLSILYGIHSEGQLLYITVSVCLMFLKTVILFFVAATAFYISVSKTQRFQFLHILPDLLLFVLLFF